MALDDLSSWLDHTDADLNLGSGITLTHTRGRLLLSDGATTMLLAPQEHTMTAVVRLLNRWPALSA